MTVVPRIPRPVGRWLGALVVLTGTAALAAAAPQTSDKAPPPPKGEPASKPADAGEKRVKFEFRDKRWGEVLEWLSEQTGLPFSSSIKPTGTFTFTAPKAS